MSPFPKLRRTHEGPACERQVQGKGPGCLMVDRPFRVAQGFVTREFSPAKDGTSILGLEKRSPVPSAKHQEGRLVCIDLDAVRPEVFPPGEDQRVLPVLDPETEPCVEADGIWPRPVMARILGVIL
jgi:hypothetical protein